MGALRRASLPPSPCDCALRAQSAALAQRQQQLQIAVAALQDPQRVSHRAQRLGMVANPTPAFIELGSGRVLGQPTPAVAGDTPDVAMTPPDAVKLGRKIFQVAAGAHSTVSIGELVVPAPVKGGHTNAGDTHGGSADPGAAGGTTVPGAATRQ